MNQRLKTPKLLEENISEILTQAMKWDYIKLESFYTAEGEKWRDNPHKRKSLLIIHLTGDQYPEYIKHSKEQIISSKIVKWSEKILLKRNTTND